ncbi:Mannosyltransferase related to Gpi18 [Williamsia serinedens]|uniref:Mannosyltransferase related to Gpi18 n=2 Tax=Williamsia serinedens TaxID=391736 RepID=A0ABT1GWD4_9NOCA|nr:Mannosyltransferase related to Gpi18 [Williamsia serinedens]
MTRPPRIVRWAAVVAVLTVALLVRWQFVHVETLDYRAFLSRWYDTLDQQGVSAFRSRFADYNYPYLYLIAGLAWLHIPSLVGIKALSIAADVVLAAIAARIAALRSPNPWVPIGAFTLVLFLPSVIANSAWWGQADGIYTACALAGILFLLRGGRGHRRRDALIACALFGLAVSFKLQAVFVLPVLAWVVLRRRVPWYAVLMLPLVYVALDVPVLIAGAPWREVFSVYLSQTDSYRQLTLGAANLYQLIPLSGDVTWAAYKGIGAALVVVVGFLLWSVVRRPAVTDASILVVAAASAIVVPFLLPAMHDRYFYAAEVLSVIAAFFLPLRYALIPVLVQAAAIGVYHSSLTGDQGGMRGGGMGSGGGGGFGGGGPRPDGAGPGAGSRPGGFRPEGGGGGPGRSGGAGSSGYTSGRGDTALTVYASMMACAAAGVVVALRRVLRRQAVSTRSPDESSWAAGA